jgi:DNA-binding transcriptional LysR family regulator
LQRPPIPFQHALITVGTMANKRKWDERVLRRLKLRDLRVLLAIAETGSMGKTAAQLAISQPVVSKAIGEIERVIGVRLLNRTPQGVEPTLYGRALIKWGLAVFDDLRRGLQEIDALSDPGSGEVRLGTTDSMLGGFVPVVIDRFSRQYPKAVFEVLPASTFADQYVELRERRIDFILGRLATPTSGANDLDTDVLFRDPMFLAAAVGSKWHRRRKLSLSDLCEARWSIPPHPSFVRPLIDEAFRTAGLEPPSHTVGSNSVQLATALLATGRFVGVLSGSTLRLSGKRLGLKRLPIDLPIRSLTTGIVRLKNRTLSPTAERFIDCARDVARQLADTIS